MTEKKLKQRLRRMAMLTVCAGIVFLFIGGFIALYLEQQADSVQQEQMIGEVAEYRQVIQRQIDSDFQILHTLQAFITPADLVAGDDLARRLAEANESNIFISMAYLDLSGHGVLATLGQEAAVEITLSDLAPEAQTLAARAWQEEFCLSPLFYSQITHEMVYAYAVPVYACDQLTGALLATSRPKVFEEMLNAESVLNGGGHIHLLSASGDMLIRAARHVVQEEVASLFDYPVQFGTSLEEIRAAMADQKPLFSTFRYRGKTYPFLLEPIGVNGWMLMCVDVGEGVVALTNRITTVTHITFTALLTLLMLLIIFGYRLLHSNSHELMQIAYHDPVTGAENFQRFRQRLPEALQEAGGSVALLGIRQYSFLNEIFGQDGTEQLLREIKAILQSHLRAGEFFCHESADWFYLFLRETQEAPVRQRMNALMGEIAALSKAHHHKYQLILYCGVSALSASTDPQKDAETLLSQAVFSAKRAKGAHENRIWFFDAEQHTQEMLDNYIEGHMHQAMQDGEFHMVLQPKVDLQSGRLSGAEALVRWVTEDNRTIFPNQFIPMFEKNGFVAKLDLYMVEQVCRQLRQWMDQGIEPIPISVNQSKLLLFEVDYVQRLTEIVSRYRIAPHLITLEILEGMSLRDPEEINQKLHLLQREGFRIALDDFGSEYSSLNTLGKLDIDELKLDRAFLVAIANRKESRMTQIMQTVVSMARKMQISTVVEGIETQADEALVREMGCDIGQGYFYSRPISPEAFSEKYLTGGQTKESADS